MAWSNTSDCYVALACEVHALLFYLSRILVLVPLSLFILTLAVRRRGQRRSSPSDIFMYNQMLVEAISSAGVVLYHCGHYLSVPWLEGTGSFLAFMAFYCELCSQCFTCAERHLAVLHPIAYMRVRKERRACVVASWLLCLGGSSVQILLPRYHVTPITLSLFSLALVCVSFSYINILCALIGPGPGEGGGRSRDGRHPSKLRAVNTVKWIGGAVSLGFVGVVLPTAVSWTGGAVCVLDLVGKWLNFPSTLVLPLLFLHRVTRRTPAGRLGAVHI